MYFKEKFKALRKSHDLTQEEIADIFHVSPQSISRWETGANYPDIELLPHIAGFFRVTVDELLGTEQILGEQRAKEYRRDIRNLLNTGKAREAIEMARAAVKEYPVNYVLQNHLLQALITENDEASKSEIIAVGERIVNYCTDQDIASWAKFQLIRQYAKWGMREEAKRIVYSLPAEAYYTQDLTLNYVLEGEEWQENQAHCIIRISIMLIQFIEAYAHKADIELLQKIEWLKKSMQIEEMVRPLNDYDPDARVGDAFNHICIAEFYCEAGDRENALTYAEKAVQDAMYHLEEMDRTTESGNNYYPWPTPRNLCWILWEDHLMKPQFDLVRGDERFSKCFKLLQANSKELQR